MLQLVGYNKNESIFIICRSHVPCFSLVGAPILPFAHILLHFDNRNHDIAIFQDPFEELLLLQIVLQGAE